MNAALIKSLSLIGAVASYFQDILYDADYTALIDCYSENDP
jgi:hypothetical protein